jgi:anti-anti-sigma factor
MGLFEIDRDGPTIIVTPVTDLRELNYRQIEEETDELLTLLDGAAGRNVVVDFGRTDYFGSTALVCLLRIGERVRRNGGRMALCNLSDHQAEILRVTRLNHSWLLRPSRAEAVRAVGR